MDEILPSYSQAITRDHWSLISSSIDSSDLFSATLVSRQWSHIFTARLWGAPKLHVRSTLATRPSLVKFHEVIQWARSDTRRLTHTLTYPADHTGVYGGLASEWLSNVILRLPRLQSLMIFDLSLLGHETLYKLSGLNKEGTNTTLKLLQLRHCMNTTSPGLTQVLQLCSQVVYLDLSYTISARSPSLLAGLKSLLNLQILKLRGLQLRDNDLKTIAEAVGPRIRSLDVRDNQLSDQAIKLLLKNCVLSPEQAAEVVRNNILGLERVNLSHQTIQSYRIPEIFKSDDQDRRVHSCLTSDFVHSLGIESTLNTGLTHLKISGNAVTLQGAADLLAQPTFHVLDIGFCRANNAGACYTLNKDSKSAGSTDWRRIIASVMPEIAPLRYLRIDHKIVTSCEYNPAPSKSDMLSNGSASQKVDWHNRAIISDVIGPDSSATAQHAKYERKLLPPYALASPGNFQITPLDVEGHHKSGTAAQQMQSAAMLPFILPQLKRLVLTGVPTKSLSRVVSHSLINLVSSCAEEAYWASLKARHSYDLPPGADRRELECKHAKHLFPLEQIVLEMNSAAQDDTSSNGPSKQLSSVEDPDCDTFWQAASSDFSFFENEKIKDVSSTKVANQPSFLSSDRLISQKSARATGDIRPPQIRSMDTAVGSFDVLAELARFRAERKAAYHDALKAGDHDPFIEGYWPGEIIILRPNVRR